MMLRPLSKDFSSLLDENLGGYSDKPVSTTSRKTLARFFLQLTLNTLRNIEVRRTFNLLSKHKALLILKLLPLRSDTTLPKDGTSSINLRE